MRRKTGPIDISYCATQCANPQCKRNLRFFKSPNIQYSCCRFDEENKDELHLSCKFKLLEEENGQRVYKRTNNKTKRCSRQ